MELNEIANYVGLGLETFQTMVILYTSFKKTNVEKFFSMLIDSKKDIKKIGHSDELQRYFFSIIDKISVEANQEKLKSWKNVVIHLATDFSDYDFKDNFIRTLDDLTVFDLTVLYKIYSTEFPKEHVEKEVVEFFVIKGIPDYIVMQSIKRLSSHNLINEMVDRTAVYAGSDGEPALGTLYYKKNALGQEFMRFISDED